MRGEGQITPKGWKIVVRGSISETEDYKRLIRWLESNDAYITYDGDVKNVVQPATQVSDGVRKKKKLEDDVRIVEIWKLWYETLRERHPVRIPAVMSMDEAGMAKTMLREYGKDRTLEIFRLTVLDWDAFRLLYHKKNLPPVPTLRLVVSFRRELDGGVSQKGIRTETHRVSEYGKRVGAYDDWEK